MSAKYTMQFIGYYYSDNGLCNLYKSPKKKDNWVSNICYYDSYMRKFYSPNIKNIAVNGRNIDKMRKSENYWSKFITLTHDSFVLKNV
jgi:hypothetical protein